MAWGTHAERRAAVERSLVKASVRAQDHRAREASYRLQGKHEKAEKHRATAARQERIALTHRQEIDRLEVRARFEAQATVTAAQRAHEMVKAQERAEAAAAAQPEIDPFEAYAQALTHAADCEEQADRSEKKARAYSRAGGKQEAATATRAAEANRMRARQWREEAERIQAGTERDLAREVTLAIKAKRRLESQTKNEETRLARLGVVSDPRTAAGQREIASGGAKKGVPVGSLRDYAGMIRKPQERTRARLEAMEEFDTLCGTADAGLFPELKLERESTGGHGPGEEIMARRCAGLAEMDRLNAAIGARNVDMLRAWIHDRQTLTALVRGGYGTEKTVGALVLAAVDVLAVFLKTSEQPSAGNETRRHSRARSGAAA